MERGRDMCSDIYRWNNAVGLWKKPRLVLKKSRCRHQTTPRKNSSSMSANIVTENQKSKRYVVNVSFYMDAEDDQAIIREANHFAMKLNNQMDCQASVDEIRESEFGKIGTKKIM